MHYVGMEAMRMQAMCLWDTRIVAASVGIAIVVSLVAMLLAFRFRGETRALSPLKLASAVVMGFAVAGMHYTGMAAATFVPGADDPRRHRVGHRHLGARHHRHHASSRSWCWR